MRFERNLAAQIEALYRQLLDSREQQGITPQNVQAVVEIALQLAGQPPLIAATLPGIWPDLTGERQACPVFQLPTLRGSWAACAEGLEHPHTRTVRPIVFDHELARGRDDVVLAHLGHRLVQLAMRLLRAEVWSTKIVAVSRASRPGRSPIQFPSFRSPGPRAPGDHRRGRPPAARRDRGRRRRARARGRFRRLGVTQIDSAVAAAGRREVTDAVKADLQVQQIAENVLASLETWA